MGMHRAISYHRHGDPMEVLSLERCKTPIPGTGEVRVELLAATVNPSDFGRITGTYGHLDALPAVAGREGVGRVESLGEGVDTVEVGTLVRFPPEAGVWQQYACASVGELQVVPQAVPVRQAVQSFINPPTAYCLLTKLVHLPAGSWIMQNAGNSAVGMSVIQMAKVLGYRTISEVRRPSVIKPLQALGADVVVVAGSGWHRSIQELTGGGTVPLALNSIGGTSALDQIRALAEGGTQVTFGAMVRDPVRFPTRELIFKDLHLTGFWWDRWVQEAGVSARDEVMREVFCLMESGQLKLPIEAVFALNRYKDAFAHFAEPRMGKVLLAPNPEAFIEQA